MPRPVIQPILTPETIKAMQRTSEMMNRMVEQVRQHHRRTAFLHAMVNGNVPVAAELLRQMSDAEKGSLRTAMLRGSRMLASRSE